MKLASAAVALLAHFAGMAAALGGRRGWNTYDGWNGAANESELIAGAEYMKSNLLSSGYEHVVVDGGWYNNDTTGGWVLDAWGRPSPNPVHYPSARSGNGFRSIADAVHAAGLKFGVWSIRGIPVVAVENKWRIWNSTFTADQAARLDQNCSWEKHNVGVQKNDAARAYYRSVAAWFSQQTIDFVKIDCMVSDSTEQGFYSTDDFTMYAEAMAEFGITVSVSPGTGMNPANASYIASNSLAALYRVTQDMWDLWDDHGKFYPTGLKSKLSVLPTFSQFIGINGSFPDPDMMPLGRIYHNDKGTGIYGPPSPTHFTNDEQVLLMTLWCITRAPLMFGGRLPLDPVTYPTDAWTLQLLTNAEVLQVQSDSTNNRPIAVQASNTTDLHAWTAQPASGSGAYIALFNAQNAAATVGVTLADAGLSSTQKYCVRDLWSHSTANAPVTTTFVQQLPMHGAGLYLFTPATASACN